MHVGGIIFLKLNCVKLPATTITTKRNCRIMNISIGPSMMRAVGRNGVRVIRPRLSRVMGRIIQANGLHTISGPRRTSTFFIMIPAPFGRGRHTSVACIRSTAHSMVPCLERKGLFIVRSASPMFAARHVTRIVCGRHPRLGSGVCVTCYPRHMLPNGALCRLIRGSQIVNNIGPRSATGTVRFCSTFMRNGLRPAGTHATRVYGLARGSSHSSRVTFTGRLSVVYSGTNVGI